MICGEEWICEICDGTVRMFYFWEESQLPKAKAKGLGSDA